MTQQQQSREFDVSDLSPIPWLGKRKEFDAISGPREGLFDMVLEPSFDFFAVFQSLYLKKKRSKMPIYKAWDVKRETRKAVAAGSFEEFAKAGELFLISEIQSDMYSECLQRGYGTIIFSLTDLFKVYNTCYLNQTSVLYCESNH